MGEQTRCFKGVQTQEDVKPFSLSDIEILTGLRTIMIDLDEDERAHLEANIAWLAAADPDDWHRVSLDFNWSEPLYLLDWIVHQPDCDVATALDILWKGEPECWLEEEGSSDEEPDGYSYLNAKICVYIAKRVREGGYTRSEIAYSPETGDRSRYLQLADNEKALQRPNIRACSELIRDRAGRVVDVNADFYQRYPKEFHLSSYDEEFAEAVEQGLFFTPETRANWERYQKFDHKALRNMPDWIKPGPDSIDIEAARTEAVSFVFNMVFVGVMLLATLTGQLARLGGAIGWAVGSAAMLYLSYSAFSSYRKILDILGPSGREPSRSWVAGAAATSIMLGAGVSYLVAGQIGPLWEAYGFIPVVVAGFAIALPALWFASKYLVGITLTKAALR
jgi:Domain of unknown function (DUF4274)